MLASSVATFQDNSSHGEDSFLVRDLGSGAFLDVVSDGGTGHGGEEASQSVAAALDAVTINSIDDIVAVLDDQNEEFFQVGGGRFLLTTISAALYLDGKLYIVSAGDSPAYHSHGDAFDQLAGRIGGLLRGGAVKVIGGDSTLTLTRLEVDIQPGDRILLATDGVSDNLDNSDLRGIIQLAASVEDASSSVQGTVKERLEAGLAPSALGGRYRHDDQTAVFRFFDAG